MIMPEHLDQACFGGSAFHMRSLSYDMTLYKPMDCRLCFGFVVYGFGLRLNTCNKYLTHSPSMDHLSQDFVKIQAT